MNTGFELMLPSVHLLKPLPRDDFIFLDAGKLQLVRTTRYGRERMASHVWWDSDALRAILILEDVRRLESVMYDSVGVASRHCLSRTQVSGRRLKLRQKPYVENRPLLLRRVLPNP